jgi:peptide/nickel transport system substrate-binding protein
VRRRRDFRCRTSLPNYYAYTKDVTFTPYPDELRRFWESRWK